MTPTMKDIAKQCGVSVATVSLVLSSSNSAVPISEATRKLVSDTARKLGYRKNTLAAALVTGRSQSIGLISEIPVDSFTAQLVAGVEAVCDHNSYSLIYCHASHKNTDILLSNAGLLTEHCVDALIVCTMVNREHSAHVIAELESLRRPVILVDQSFENCGLCSVVTDDLHGMMHAVEHLIRLGHTRIGFAAMGGSYTSDQRLLGYRAALARAEIRWDASLLVDGIFTEASGARSVDQMLALPDPPTAIVAANDSVAAGIIRRLAERGISVPRDMSVLGYADFVWADMLGLTTVRQPAYDLGHTAADLAIAMIGDDSFLNRRVVLPVELVVRQSTDVPRNGGKGDWPVL